MRARRGVERNRQRGVVLLVVMVMVLLSTLLMLASARTAWFSQRLSATEADHHRAFANAQAMLRDAEFDIRGERPDGTPCTGGSGASAAGAPGGPNCRGLAPSLGEPWIPRAGKADHARLHAVIMASAAASGTPCTLGICLPGALPDGFWKQPSDELIRLTQGAARFAQFSGAAPANDPLLTERAWYWIEVLPFAGPFGTAEAPDADNPFVFRITALAEGRRLGTRVALQRLFVWKRVDA